MDPKSPKYNIGECIQIHGPLDGRLFEAALRRASEEHESLNLEFVVEGDTVYQRVVRKQVGRCRTVDLTGTQDPAAAAEQYMTDDMETVDSLTCPRHTFALLKLGPDLHFWYVRYHHIALDGLSGTGIARRVAELYTAAVRGEQVPELRAPLSELVEDETGYHRSAEFARDREYWTQKFGGLAPRTPDGSEQSPSALSARDAAFIQRRPAAPGAHRDSPVPVAPGTHLHQGRSLPLHVMEGLRRVASETRTTWPAVFVSAVAAYVSRVTGSLDVGIGLASNGRRNSMRRIAGMTANILPLHIHLTPGMTVADLVRTVAAEMRPAIRHRRYSREQLARELKNIGATAQLSDIVVNVMPYGYDFDFAGSPGVSRLLSTGPVDDVSLFLYERSGDKGPLIGFDINRELYRPEDVLPHQQAITHLIEELAQADLTSPVSRLRVLDDSATKQILETGRGGDLPVGVSGASLPELFAERVKAAPDAVAVSSSNGTLTYGELDQTSAELAACLSGHGVGAEDGVGVLLTRAPGIVTASLAAVRASAMYVPLDHQWPTERLHQTAHTARLRALIVDRETATHPWVQHMRTTLPVLVVDALGHVTDGAPASPAPLPTVIGGAQLAYMMFTSGSTGTPKGVGITHRDITALTADTTWANTPHTILMHSAYVFDASTFEIWVPLLTGGRIAIAPPGPLEPHTLHHLITTQNVTALFLTTALFNTLADTTPQLLGTLRLVATGGEKATPGLLQQLATTHPHTTFHHVYGPTETTTFATRHAVTPHTPTGPPPIGHALDGMRTYVLDTALNPVPPGVTGELYLAGPGVARGYTNRPDLTATRFTADPFTTTGDRMYRTGDLVRWNHHNELEYISRADTQIKLRGYRIEPTEIETALRSHPSVKTALVTLREDIPGASQLVAYVVSADGGPLHPDTLAAEVGRSLPSYMVPSAFVRLDSLPLNPNGKIDRKALPAPEAASATGGRRPRTPQEEILCGLFADILNRDHITIDDNFFTLGGHSLLATRLTSRIRTTLNAEIEIRTLFEHPTVATLATALDTAHHARPTLTPHKRPDHLPLSHAQQRLWFLNRYEGPSPTYNIPLVLRLDGPLDTHALSTAITDLVERHETLRTVLVEEGGVPHQQVHPAAEARGLVPLIVESAPVGATSEQAARWAQDSVASAAGGTFDLAGNPAVRVKLLRLTAEAHVLVLVVHHIAADGWSLAPLARDLGQAYRARTRSTSPDWTPLPVQYADYTLWQHHTLGEENDPESLLSRQLGFWQEKLTGLPERIELPLDRPRPVVATHAGGAVPFLLGEDDHRGLAQLARSSGCSMFMVLQAALAVLLCRHGAGDDIPLGTAVAGRSDEALEDLVGFFVNTLVLRTDLSGDPTFREILARVRAFDLAAYAHEDVPFERLVEAVNPERSQSHHPLFQTMLVLQNQATAGIDMPGVVVTDQSVHTDVSKFDLTFSLTETQDDDGEPAGLTGYLEFSTELFERSTAQSLADRLSRLLAGVVADPEQRVHRMQLLTQQEQSELLAAGRGPAGQVPRLTVPEAFQAQAARTPDAVAVRDADGSLTYGELNARANALAHHLTNQGIGPEDLIALALPRTNQLPTTTLAILKTGAAYLPIDPTYPHHRTTHILNTTKPTHLITTTHLNTQLPTHTIPTTHLNTHQPTTPHTTNPTHTPHPHHPAYLIHTSGSTGQP
ncbi:amino acid adenylation domain-containing protein, partial [Streptomyces sp. NPDC059398]|uniref:amino acid adenylation domain-containing protein n=1 Tax=Streptomyces sp. NPDC059398 TaxID=3346820 RepID=UPI0036BA0317